MGINDKLTSESIFECFSLLFLLELVTSGGKGVRSYGVFII
jgi:hypothetical protein